MDGTEPHASGRAKMHDITYVGLDVYKAIVCVMSEGTKSAPISEKSRLGGASQPDSIYAGIVRVDRDE
jgi:hypothetical protein